MGVHMGEMRFTRRQVLAAGAAAPLSLAMAKVAGATSAFAPVSAAASSSNPADLSIVELLPLLEGRQLSAQELVEACITRVERLDPEIKAFERPTFDLALAGAKAVDEARAAGRPVGPLAGVPVGLKDLYYTKGVPTTASSKVLDDFVPDYDATVWARLAAAGMVLLGKLRTAEFAMSTNSSPCVNPWDTMRGPGGSSGGSGAALAARMLPAALGTDTATSIRNPAAMCGVSGLKPTYGRCSRHGVIPLSWSLDHVGPMARRMADCALLLQVMAGADPADPTSLQAAVPDYPTTPPSDLAGVRIGVPDRFFWEAIDAEVERVCREGLDRLAALGAEVVTVPAPPSTDEVLGRAVNPYGSSDAAPRQARRLPQYRVPRAHQLPPSPRRRAAPPLLAGDPGQHQGGRDRLGCRLSRRPAAPVGMGAGMSGAVRRPSAGRRGLSDGAHRTDVPGPVRVVPLRPVASAHQGVQSQRLPLCVGACRPRQPGSPLGLQLASPPLEEPRLLSIAIALDEDVRFFTRKPPIVEGA